MQFTTIGIAAGYIFGGVIGPPLGWRAAFLLQVDLSLTSCMPASHCKSRLKDCRGAPSFCCTLPLG